MDIIHLISKTPGLLDSLKAIGLSSEQVAKFGGELTQQLRAQGEFDLSDLLKSMDVRDFEKRVDVGKLTEKADISPDQVQAAANLLAPAVEAFGLDTTNIVAKMASSLFKKN